MKSNISFISVPNDLNYLKMVLKFADENAQLCDFENNDRKKIQLAVDESFSNIIKSAFDTDQHEMIEIHCEIMPLGLEIILKDKGKPFDPELFAKNDEALFADKLNRSKLDRFLIREMMDKVSYKNLGKRGKETILVKFLNHQSIHHILKSQEQEKPVKPVTKDIKYGIREMKPHEAVYVSTLVYFAYRYSYPYENIYYPERLREMNKSGKLVSYVAVTEDDKILSHSALEFHELKSGIAEIGMAFTDTHYRGLGCFNKLWEIQFKLAEDMGVTGIYAMCVTTHPYSQKGAHKFGMHDVVLLVSKVPFLSFESIDTKKEQRESILKTYRYFIIPEKLILYPPENHATMIEKILNQFSINTEMIKCDLNEDKISKEHSEIHTEINSVFITADILINEFGKDIVRVITKTLKHLCIDRIESIYLYMNLSDPATGFYAGEFEKMGFFFAGVLPQEDNKVSLVMQYLNNQRYNFDKLQMDTEFAKELTEYVKGEYDKFNE
ncbi:ATP-binding protein [Bacteroidota bacterium]